jgi:hypothetical protein
MRIPIVQIVMRGLDPRIHREKIVAWMMDCRVKPHVMSEMS